MKLPMAWVAGRLPGGRVVGFGLLVALFGMARTATAQTTVQFEKASYSAGRNDGTVTVRVTLGGAAPTSPVTAQLSAADGTAKSGEDYEFTTQSVLLDKTVTFFDYPVTIKANGEVVPEFFTLSLSNVSSNAMLGVPSQAVIFLQPRSEEHTSELQSRF